MPVSRTGLDALFLPASVAVIGATERPGTVGRTVLEKLLHPSFQGQGVCRQFAARRSLRAQGIRRVFAAVPDKVDLAVVATPANTVPQIIGECVDAGVKSAVVISAGFRERGAEGVKLERQIQEQLGRGAMRLIGPNCLGIMNPTIGLNATFAKDAPCSRQRCFSEPERGLADRDSRLGPTGAGGLQRDRLHRLHAGRGLGRSDLPLWR